MDFYFLQKKNKKKTRLNTTSFEPCVLFAVNFVFWKSWRQQQFTDEIKMEDTHKK